MRRCIALAIAGSLIAAMAGGQGPTHEYRPQLIVTLPRWHGAALVLVDEQHLATGTLDAVERQQGIALSFAHVPVGSASVELRQVVADVGTVEHRYIGNWLTSTALDEHLELGNRARLELRDIAGTWSHRYQERVSLARCIVIDGRALQPYGLADLSYDSRYRAITRREGTLGIRIPLGRGVSIDPFVMRQTDSRRAIPTVVATGLTTSVAL